MDTGEKGIAVGCTTCRVDLFLEAGDETQARANLTRFFDQHDGCHVFMDVGRTTAPLPGRASR